MKNCHLSMSGGGSLQLTKYLPLSHCTYCKDLLLIDNVHVLKHKFREVLHSSPLSIPVLGKSKINIKQLDKEFTISFLVKCSRDEDFNVLFNF